MNDNDNIEAIYVLQGMIDGRGKIISNLTVMGVWEADILNYAYNVNGIGKKWVKLC